MMEENLEKINDFENHMQEMKTHFEDMKNQMMEWEDEPEDAEENDQNEEIPGKVLYFLLKVIQSVSL